MGAQRSTEGEGGRHLTGATRHWIAGYPALGRPHSAERPIAPGTGSAVGTAVAKRLSQCLPGCIRGSVGIALIGVGTVIALDLRGAAQTFHEVIPEYRRRPRHLCGLRILGGVLRLSVLFSLQPSEEDRRSV